MDALWLTVLVLSFLAGCRAGVVWSRPVRRSDLSWVVCGARAYSRAEWSALLAERAGRRRTG